MVVSVIVPVELATAAEVLASQLAPSEGQNFVIRLSASGQEPATHLGCQPVVTAEVAEQISGFVESPTFSGSGFFEVVSSDYLLAFDSLATAMSLVRIEQVKP